MSKWYPTLLCPIPKGHANNACDTFASGVMAHAHKKGQSISSVILQVFLQRREDEKNPQFAVLPQPSAYFRLFKKRTKDKERWKYSKPKIEYLIFKPNGEYIGKCATLKEAKHDLSRDVVTLLNSRKQVEIPVGSYVLKYINDPWAFDAHWRFGRPNIHNNTPVAVKRCKECPNKTSKQGMCHCGFWSAIRDNTESKVWWPIHDRKMFDLRRKKAKQRVIHMSIRLRDLLD
jgi:hypothetical protein